MIPKSKTVEEYASTIQGDRRAIFDYLRGVLLDMGFEEKIKWRMPVFSVHGRNAIWLGAFKLGMSLSFFEGNRVDDYLGVLINAQEGKTEAMRHWRFNSLDEVPDEHLRVYISQAIDIAANPINQAITKKTTVIPDLLLNSLQSDMELKMAFEALAPYKQREFCEHIETAKRIATKESRLQKIIPMIRAGIGLGDKYRK